MGNLSSQPPRALPVIPTAPAGLARDSANGNLQPATSATTHKKTKAKQTAANEEPVSGPIMDEASAPAGPEPAAHENESSKASGTALNLAEPATPTPSPEADKAPPEPDEPPTVNSTPPVAASHHASTNTPAAQQP
jgi:hypothetical protein